MTRLGSAAAAAVLAVATTVLPGATLAPASAAACADAGGVTVVVDPGSLGGSVTQACVGSSGDDAAALFGAAGHALERVQRFPGAVCRIDGAPASANCGRMPPTNAYWALFWSDGTSGSWVYSSAGVDNVDVPAGGSVAFAWQSSNNRRNPATPPPDHDGSGGDDPGGGTGGTGGTGGGGGRSGGGNGGDTGGGDGGSTGGASSDSPPSASPSATGSPTGEASEAADGKRDRGRGADDAKRERPRDRQSETAEPSEASPTVLPDAVDDEVATASQPVADGGLPLWLVGLAAGCLLVAGAVVAVVRRKAAHGA